VGGWGLVAPKGKAVNFIPLQNGKRMGEVEKKREQENDKENLKQTTSKK